MSIIDNGTGWIYVDADPNLPLITPGIGEDSELANDITNGIIYKWDRVGGLWKPIMIDFTITDGSTPFTLADSETITIQSGASNGLSVVTSDTGPGGTISIDFSAVPVTGGVGTQLLEFNDVGDVYSWTDKSAINLSDFNDDIAATEWIENTDATLTGARTITQAGFDFGFTGGNIGIGTTTPLYALHVIEDATFASPSSAIAKFESNTAQVWARLDLENVNSDGALIVFQDDNGIVGIRNNSTDGRFRFFQGATNRMELLSAGQLALYEYKTSFTTDNDYLLNINSADGKISKVLKSSIPLSHFNDDITATEWIQNTNATLTSARTITQAGFDFAFTGGNVGIGTTTPNSELNVIGTIWIGSGTMTPSAFADDLVIDNGFGNTGITIEGTGDGSIFFADSLDNDIGRIVYDHSVDDLSLWVNNGERLTIDSVGNVGINISLPEDLLHIYSSTDAANIRAEGVGQAANIILEVSTITDRARTVYSQAAGTNRWDVGVDSDSTGNFYIGEGANFANKYFTILDNNGFVGLDKTAPEGRLHVKDTVFASMPIFEATQNNSNAALRLRSSAGDFSIMHGGSTNSFANYLSFYNGTNRVVTIDGATGNVGIGTDHKGTELLDIKSPSVGSQPLVVTSSGSSDRLFEVEEGGSGHANMFLYNSSGTKTVQITSAGDSYIDAANFGVGTTSPSGKVHIISEGSVSELIVEAPAAGGNPDVSLAEDGDIKAQIVYQVSSDQLSFCSEESNVGYTGCTVRMSINGTTGQITIPTGGSGPDTVTASQFNSMNSGAGGYVLVVDPDNNYEIKMMTREEWDIVTDAAPFSSSAPASSSTV